MAAGALNPSPFRVGGGPTPSEKAYRTIRNAVGQGGSAPNDRGIDGLWRRSRAKGLAAASSAKRRALVQAFPHLATDALPYYERLLGLVPEGPEAERRDPIVRLFSRRPIRNTPSLEQALQAIDSRLSLLDPSHEKAAIAQDGREFAPHASSLEAPAFNLRHVLYPNYSTDMVVRVLFAVSYDGALRAADLRVVERARELLRGALSSWVDFTITIGPWRLGNTPIGFGDTR